MPVDFVSFWLKPFGFFDRNPTLDLPPATSVRWRGAAGVLSESVAPRTRKCVYGGPPTQSGVGRERRWGRVGKVGGVTRRWSCLGVRGGDRRGRSTSPKSTGLSVHSREDLAAAAQLNSRPRKTLDWKKHA
jgi:hypothetical protein